jgi:UDP:flavonoid glycosyltransferase YjiC (YdhE family)
MSRVLFTFAGGSGHADPLVPIALAIRAAGHEVAFHGRRSGAATAVERGFALFADLAEAPGDPRSIAPLAPVDRGREERDFRAGFAERLARARAAKIEETAATWRPDVIVCDEADFGAMLVAERLGIPNAIVLVSASGSFGGPGVVEPALRRVRRDLALDPDGLGSMLRGRLTLNPFPPSFRDPRFPLPNATVSFRPAPAGGTAALPVSLERLGDVGPAVYVTLGTIFPAESGDLFPRLLAALRALEVHAIVTVGRELDPAVFGPQPDRIVVERFVPQGAILPRCDVVVNHAGSGSILGALAHGLPIVALPLGADQPWNADRVEALGLGVVLDAITATPDELAAAIDTALGDATMRARATAMRDELERLPGVESTVPHLEQLLGTSGTGAT